MKKILTTTALVAGLAASGAQAQQHWNLQSTYPGSLTQLGTLGIRLAEQITRITGGEIEVTFQNPGGVVPALEVFDAVGSGAVEAGWSTPGYWAGRVPALQLLAAVPFGPQAPEYLAWLKFGGGQEFLDELYEPHNIKSIICAVIAPEASGWFRNEINSVEDLRGLSMRFFGLGAKVMERMGVSTQLLAGGDIFPALELGTIDATEFSMPAIDLNLGFYQVASYYYFPGWHQQSTFFDLMINLDLWEELDEGTQFAIETVCDANIAYGLAEGEALQFDALRELEEEHGVNIRQWADEDLAALEAAWEEVAAELVAEDEDFARVYESYTTFRANYARWREIGYLD
ncbi:TRAP transporter substrate-binding protein [Pararhodobacter sp. CCB-MM2]|uniref:TRAP transporter substrate-binding protein n=1 Tax=Pararhodobacter sp. CCB-MM2 TaxID=1786003 RepID=UPI00082D6E7A|nr:TRAP transporter substrate-binding protein [Pararhodobacter sp. CCB-MM2]MCA2010680.1 TRAP transporter substrate-binding protein [Cereibacter sphaeroides]